MLNDSIFYIRKGNLGGWNIDETVKEWYSNDTARNLEQVKLCMFAT